MTGLTAVRIVTHTHDRVEESATRMIRSRSHDETLAVHEIEHSEAQRSFMIGEGISHNGVRRDRSQSLYHSAGLVVRQSACLAQGEGEKIGALCRQHVRPLFGNWVWRGG